MKEEEKPPTLEFLEQRKKEVEDEEKRCRLAISLGICPVCGSAIISQNYEEYEVPKGLIFKSKGKMWEYRRVCSKNKEHYEDKNDYDT